ncbi:MAG: GH116 family glycosyl-hydrolase [Acidobacteriota bacterium]
MKQGSGRRTFLKQVAAAGSLGFVNAGNQSGILEAGQTGQPPNDTRARGAISFPRVLTGDQLAMVAFPLGGIGTGSICLGGRGQLRDWEIFNRPEKGRFPTYTFPTIWAKTEGSEPVTRVLESKLLPPYEGRSGAGWRNAPGLPRLDGAVFTGEFPFARIDFQDHALPVDVRLEAFNPFIPLDPEASGIPIAVLRYQVKNPGPRKMSVAIAFNLDNPVGKAGRINEYREGHGVKGLFMANPSLDPLDPDFGNFALAVTAESGAVSHLVRWGDFAWALALEDFWKDMLGDGLVGDDPHLSKSLNSAQKGDGQRHVVGSLCALQTILPGEEKQFTYFLTWHFPNRTPERCGWYSPEGEEKTIIGNYYCARFTDAWDVLARTLPQLGELEKKSRIFYESLRMSTLPGAVLDAALANLTTLKTNTCFRTKDGRFHGFEGCAEKGCCPGSCTHVWNYESALPHLFPSLSRSLLDSWFGFSTDEQGLMDFRYYLPYGKKRFGHAAADGQMGSLVRLYLDWQLTGDLEWLRQVWPKAKKALEFAWIKGGWDEDQDGMMEGCQHNTYDVAFFGPNPFSGVIYLAALRAGEEIAQALGDNSSAARYRQLFESGSRLLDSSIFNGEYYIQKIQGRPESEIAKGLMIFETDPDLPDTAAFADTRDPFNQMGEGCLSDQLLGQSLAHVAGVGHLLDRGKIHSALDSIYRYCFRRDLSEHQGVLRIYALNDDAGVVICDYKACGRPAPKKPFFFYSEVWSGIEYQLAAHMFFEGKYREALEIVTAVRNRHDGIRRNPWDEPECGHHYARALASWSCILALSGFRYHAPESMISLEPRMPANPVVGFWSAASGWGSYVQKISGTSVEIEVWTRHGRLACQKIALGSAVSPTLASVSAFLDDEKIAASLSREGPRATVQFDRKVDISAEKTLSVRLSKAR